MPVVLSLLDFATMIILPKTRGFFREKKKIVLSFRESENRIKNIVDDLLVRTSTVVRSGYSTNKTEEKTLPRSALSKLPNKLTYRPRSSPQKKKKRRKVSFMMARSPYMLSRLLFVFLDSSKA